MPLPLLADPQAPAAPPPVQTGPTEEQQALAREIAAFFRNGKEERRATDLWREMLLVHLDGTGDGQYAILVDGAYVYIPWVFAKKARVQWNLLRPITANMVKHHTAIPYRCTVELSGTRKERKRARAAAAYGNHVILDQKLNVQVAEALWLAAPYGHCPLHFQWQWDATRKPYEPLYLEGDEAAQYAQMMRPGYTKAWAGDPWNTVYNNGAKRTSVHRMCYAVAVPLSLVKNSFRGKPGVEQLKGRKDLPSASRFQMAVRRAQMQAGTGTHGSAAITGSNDGEEIIVLLCDELAPGIDPQWPAGRLSVVALDGIANVDDNPQSATPLWLHTGRLPAARFSAIRVYSTDSLGDVLGHPFLAELDDLQVSLNQLATLRRERIRRFARTQLLAQSNSLEDDTLVTVDDAILYYSGQQPSFLSPPTAEVGLIDNDIRDTMEAMFRIGGWQAASRGEGKAGDAAAKVVALANADDSIFSSANRMLQEEVCEGLATACALAKESLLVPMQLKTTGTDLGYLGELTRDELPDEPPSYTLTQGSASPEARLQQNINLATTAVAGTGEPLMSKEQFDSSNPDPSLRPVLPEVQRQRRVRPVIVADAIESAAESFIEQNGEIPPQWLPMAAQQLHLRLWQEFRIEDGDDPQLNLDALDELILDESVHPLAREVARQRRVLIAQWQAELLSYQQMIAAGGQAQIGAMQGGMQGGGGAPQMMPTESPFAGSPTSNEMASAGGEVRQLTAAATR